ncbi:class I ribonucleotide reductase maintenance protein YfaE [Tatumella punctata]|uniref:Class I ribonucleotide reductase maintenance protein YfaE n=1 Tax=Tatumella punctata TaxID=399969 RepID=A0ABW1VPT5_9GAMM
MPDKPEVITLSRSGRQLECAENAYPDLLTALEAHQLPVEYQCREGYCGSCRVRLRKGQVCYRSKPLAFVGQGEILPCCCRPVGDIELDL